MLEIETAHLRLLPLTYAQLLLVRNGFHELEKELSLSHSVFELNAPPEFMQEFYRSIESHTIPAVEAHPDSYTWYTHWLIIDRESNTIAGGIGGTGLPDQNHETIIGYFISSRFEGKGFATEAVAALTDWMFIHPGLKAVIAFTEKEDNSSVSVLKKNSFIAAGVVEEGFKWSKARK